MAKFEIGDVVRLNSGGPEMTIIDEEDTNIKEEYEEEYEEDEDSDKEDVPF